MLLVINIFRCKLNSTPTALINLFSLNSTILKYDYKVLKCTKSRTSFTREVKAQMIIRKVLILQLKYEKSRTLLNVQKIEHFKIVSNFATPKTVSKEYFQHRMLCIFNI